MDVGPKQADELCIMTSDDQPKQRTTQLTGPAGAESDDPQKA
jgi:hypothetical protein